MSINISAYDLYFKIIKEVLDSTNVIKSLTKITESKDEKNNTQVILKNLREQISVAQDVAIAMRIETADEVEIEEFYDNSNEGNIGVKGDTSGIGFGIGGSGRIVAKRTYKFKGYNDMRIEAYERMRDSVLDMDNDNSGEI